MKSLPVCIFGGTGVFGRIIVQELSRSEVPFRITVAARHRAKFEAVYSAEPTPPQFQPADLSDPASVSRALQGQKILILAAGPFQDFSPELGGLAVRHGVHYLDIGDWPAYYFGLQTGSQAFQQAGLACIPGLSSLPGISIPLFCTLREEFDSIAAVRVGLFIGNRNRKGFAAMASALRSESAPRPAFPFPEPIGTVPAFSLSTPEEKLIQGLGESCPVEAGVSFEWSWARRAFAWLRKSSQGRRRAWLDRTLRVFSSALGGANFGGTERGCVAVWARGLREGRAKTFRVSLSAAKQSQRMAALPCVLAAEALAREAIPQRGWLAPQQWLEPATLIRRLVDRGLELRREEL